MEEYIGKAVIITLSDRSLVKGAVYAVDEASVILILKEFDGSYSGKVVFKHGIHSIQEDDEGEDMEVYRRLVKGPKVDNIVDVVYQQYVLQRLKQERLEPRLEEKSNIIYVLHDAAMVMPPAYTRVKSTNEIVVCKEAVKEAMVSNDRVITLLHKINEKLKHNVDRPIVYHGTTLHTNKLNVMYQECSQNGVEGCARAYFSGPPATIVLCTNRLPSDDQVVEAFTHELIHAYDYTVRGMDITQGTALACSEIRAAREAECYDKAFQFCNHILKGPCTWWKKRCVRTHASSATSNLFQRDGKQLVENTFETCYKDESPFH